MEILIARMATMLRSTAMSQIAAKMEMDDMNPTTIVYSMVVTPRSSRQTSDRMTSGSYGSEGPADLLEGLDDDWRQHPVDDDGDGDEKADGHHRLQKGLASLAGARLPVPRT
jgi:hypothetical protein